MFIYKSEVPRQYHFNIYFFTQIFSILFPYNIRKQFLHKENQSVEKNFKIFIK